MSEEHGDDMNFNELVGSLLSSHNADKGSSESDIENGNTPSENDKSLIDKEVPDGMVVDLPDFRAEPNEDEEEDLAAVVQSAIQNMEQEPQDEEVPTNDHFDQQEEGRSVGNDDDHQQQQEWAQILQQGILNTSDTVRNANNHTEEHLDQDDENLRRAILESLQELNAEDKVQVEKGQEELVNEKREEKSKKSKKSSKKKRKDKPKSKDHDKEKTVSTRKKKHSKEHKTNKNDKNDDNQNLLNFEDVIKGFMQQESEPPQAEGHQVAEVGDAETQALVEATLKAFEHELLGPSGNVASSSHHHKSSLKKKMPAPTASSSSSKKKSKSKKPDSESKSVAHSSTVKPRASTAAPSEASKNKKKRSTKTIEKSQDTYEEDEFSRALAEMVNQVVNTSLTEPPVHSTGVPETQQDSPSSSKVAGFTSEEHPSISSEQGEDNDETFDLNQIMQKAMAMAFQEQSQEGLETSVMEEFNRGLGDLSVSELLTPGAVPSKEKKTDKSAKEKQLPKKGKLKEVNEKDTETYEDNEAPIMTATKKRKALKAQPSLEDMARKKYSQIAMAAASAARKRLVEKNKAAKFKMRSERRKARDDRRLRKKEEKDKLELERKELEEIVSRGPPYPPYLRLTKSGKPKKPYRRWTQEELEKRASMPPEELDKPRQAKKPRKKKSKKPKKIPLSSLKKIPLFNFIKGNVPSAIGRKLNGIEDTLTKIPLQTYRVDINKLAPPNTVTPEEIERENSIKEEDAYKQQVGRSFSFAFDAARKTVIRREKIPFHPPWVIPRHPPYALAVARRRRKEKLKRTKDYTQSSKKRKQSKDAKASIVFNAKSKIVPAILFPIINTLKAAARAKAASGASSEEASKHLMTIIKHTKKSIAQTLALARKHSIKDYSAIKTEKDLNELQDKDKSVKRIPIFSLAKIREIDTGGEICSANRWSKSEGNNNPSVIKIEDEDTFEMLAPATAKLLEGRDEEKALKTFSGNIEEVDKQNAEDNTLGKVQNESDLSKNQLIDISDEPNTPSNNERMSSEKQPQPILSKFSIEEFASKESAQRSDLQLPNFKSEGEIIHNINKEVEILRPMIADQNNLNGKEEVRNILEKLVKQQLTNSHGGNVDLPTNLSNIISSTIGELIPGIEEENEEDDEEEAGDYPKRKRHRKGPPPVLNLDGLVPPNSQRFIPKIEEKPQSITHVVSNIRKPRKKVEQTALQYTFNVPNYKDMQGKRTMLLKRAKEHLTNDEMNILKKEINKERKRKWREANVEKNWEHDLRARLKKRANIKFSEADSADKTKWFEEEIARNLAERGIKQRDDGKTDENINGKKNAGFTNLSDDEVLNMIATTLRKLDVARLLERELNEDASSLVDVKAQKRKNMIKSQENTPHMPTVGRVEQRTLEVAVPSYHAQDMTSEEIDEIDETGGIKRPYPDDISVTVPILKRPRFLSTEEKK